MYISIPFFFFMVIYFGFKAAWREHKEEQEANPTPAPNVANLPPVTPRQSDEAFQKMLSGNISFDKRPGAAGVKRE